MMISGNSGIAGAETLISEANKLVDGVVIGPPANNGVLTYTYDDPHIVFDGDGAATGLNLNSDLGDNELAFMRYGEGGNDLRINIQRTVTDPDSGEDVIEVVGSIWVRNFFSEANKLEQMTLSDGTVFTAAQLDEMALINIVGGDDTDFLTGSDADNAIAGAGGNDSLRGGKGNDGLDGGEGNDQYYYERGDGHDVIVDSGGHDILYFGEDIALGDLDFVRYGENGNDLRINILMRTTNRDTGDEIMVAEGSIWIRDFYVDGKGIEQIILHDGTILTPEDWEDELIDLPDPDSDTQDFLVGTDQDETFTAGGGNDSISGGKGDDTTDGGTGNDSFHYALGDGNDVIIDESGFDSLYMGENITLTQLQFSMTGANNETLRISILDPDDGSEAGSILVRDFEVGKGIDQVILQNGTVVSAEDIRGIITSGSSQAQNAPALQTASVPTQLPTDAFIFTEAALNGDLNVSNLPDGNELPWQHIIEASDQPQFTTADLGYNSEVGEGDNIVPFIPYDPGVDQP